jgi:hypothetical protein
MSMWTRPGPPTPPPPSNLVWGILTTVFCCLPAGIVSIVYASQVNPKWSSGDLDGAARASRNAGTWAIVSAGVTLILGVLGLILMVVGAGGAAVGADRAVAGG